MDVLPCPVCGYHAPERDCRHCGLTANEATLRGSPPRTIAKIWAGLRAVPQGFVILLRTRGIKRFLFPPVALTILVFGLLANWLWGRVHALFDAITQAEPGQLESYPSWIRWLVATKVLVWLVALGEWVFFLVTFALVAVWAFSIVYEALAGPFLDEIQGRIEEQWFGADPRKAIARPTELSRETCARYAYVALAPSVLLLAFWWFASGPATTWALALTPLPWIVLALVRPQWGRWLVWVIRLEAHTLWVSIEAAALAGLVLVCFIWLKFVPWIGPPLFFALAGFTVALSLLDIPFSRRQWSLARRLAFLRGNWLALVAFGSVASLVYVVPVFGQLFMVPAASVGGLWLLCRLDKAPLRT
jgi:uncharacterized protein involved in cysteine biosynthesis